MGGDPSNYNGVNTGSMEGEFYHLIVKGFKCGNTTDYGKVKIKIAAFLDDLFGTDEYSPVELSNHHLDQETKCLKIRFGVDDHYPTLNLDQALSKFCVKFFDSTENIRACKSLSRLGITGFAPLVECMKLACYESLFKWMHFKPDQRLKEIRDCLNRIDDESERTALWVQVATLYVSLGVSFYVASGDLGGTLLDVIEYGKNNAKLADQLLGLFTNQPKAQRNANTKAEQAKDQCRVLMKHSKAATDQMEINLDDDDACMTTHSEVLVHLIDLLEIGVQTVTLCSESKNAFLASRNASVKASVAVSAVAMKAGLVTVAGAGAFANRIDSARLSRMTTQDWEAQMPSLPMAGDSWWNLGLKSVGYIDQTPGDMERARYKLEVSNVTSKRAKYDQDNSAEDEESELQQWWFKFWSLMFIFLLVLVIIAGISMALDAESERKKWRDTTDLVEASIKYAQMCEIHLKLAYMAGPDVSSVPHSERFRLALEARLHRLNAKLPTARECEPRNLHIRLQVYGRLIAKQRMALGDNLGITV